MKFEYAGGPVAGALRSRVDSKSDIALVLDEFVSESVDIILIESDRD